MIEPASTLDMDDDTRGRMITRCVAYMTQRKIPIRDTRAVTRLLASNAGRIDGATNVKVRSYLTDTPAETFQSLETMKQWMGVRKAPGIRRDRKNRTRQVVRTGRNAGRDRHPHPILHTDLHRPELTDVTQGPCAEPKKHGAWAVSPSDIRSAHGPSNQQADHRYGPRPTATPRRAAD